MNRKAFHLLLKKYLDGNCSEEERRLIDQWYDLLEDEMPVSLTETEIGEIEAHLWEKINRPESHSRRPFLKPWVKWAAALAALFISGAYLYVDRNRPSDSLINKQVLQGALVEEFNNTAESKLVKLEDSSTVCLRPNARIAFPKQFQKNKREVYLEGEAFFEVTKNPGRPFFVYNNKLVAEVLGTSFNIKIMNNKIEVAVKTGRVAVFENGREIDLKAQKTENGVIVTPNQKVTYYPENGHFITSLADAPVPVINDTSRDAVPVKFVFDDTPVSEVLKLIENTYQIEIVLENENLGKCPFTGDISKQNLFNKLEVICQAFGVAYEVKGTRVLIKGGKVCN